MEENPNCKISIKTMWLKEEYHLDYNSIMYDVDGIYYTKQTVKSLLNAACIERASTYDGRIQAARVETTCMKKTPLIICPFEKLYAFPLVSPSNYGCPWFFPRHIVQAQQEEKGLLKIEFSNGLFTSIEGSLYTFNRQRERADHCLNHFSNKLYRQLKWDRLFG